MSPPLICRAENQVLAKKPAATTDEVAVPDVAGPRRPLRRCLMVGAVVTGVGMVTIALTAGLQPATFEAYGQPRAGGGEIGPAIARADMGGSTGLAVLVLLSLALFTIAMTTLAWMLHAWRSSEHLEATGFSRSSGEPSLAFSLLIPARHEEEVLGATLDALAQLHHPAFEVIAIIGHDDPGTEAVARAAAERHPEIVRVVIDHSVPKNKPRAMNTALPECAGDIVGVFDAEDEVHPELLTSVVDARFRRNGCGCRAGRRSADEPPEQLVVSPQLPRVLLLVSQSAPFSCEQPLHPTRRQYCLRSRRRAAGGRRLGRRLPGRGLRARGPALHTRGNVVVAYDPEVVTREETPPTLMSLFKQRTRWNQGFLQVLRKGEWRRLPSVRQRMMARYLLSMPMLQAGTGR